jgi:1-deoxy-D-xylulose-5-phosphate reductoisomerase
MSLSFQPPDHERFPCLGLAYRALERGGSLPAVLNAANEEAVASFLDGKTPFAAIPEVILEVMEAHPPAPLGALEDVLQADGWAREQARQALSRRAAARLGC